MSKFNIKSFRTKAGDQLQKIRPYSFVIFLVFVAGIYGFVVWRVQTLSDIQPTPDSVSSQVQKGQSLRIDPQIVQQLKSLQENSVSVKTLFDEARSNPFNQ
jgi:nitrate reductase NapE component